MYKMYMLWIDEKEDKQEMYIMYKLYDSVSIYSYKMQYDKNDLKCNWNFLYCQQVGQSSHRVLTTALMVYYHGPILAIIPMTGTPHQQETKSL